MRRYIANSVRVRLSLHITCIYIYIYIYVRVRSSLLLCVLSIKLFADRSCSCVCALHPIVLAIVGMALTTRATIAARYPKGMIDQIQSIIDKTKISERNAKVVKAKDDILDALGKNDGSYETEVPPHNMGVHPANRDSERITADGVARRGSKVVSSGGSMRVVHANEPTAFEDNPETKHIEKSQLDMCAQSPKFARYNAGQVKAGSVSVSHFNHFLAAAIDGVDCDIDNISDNGKMSRAKIFSDEVISGLAQRGIRFRVIKWDIEVLFPALPDLLQAAFNVPGQVMEGAISWVGGGG